MLNTRVDGESVYVKPAMLETRGLFESNCVWKLRAISVLVYIKSLPIVLVIFVRL